MASTSSSSPAIASGDLADLVASANAAVTVHPSDDTLLQVLQARFRADQPYSRIQNSHFVVINPYKSLSSVNDASAREYEERCYRDTAPVVQGQNPVLQPHVYELAARTYLMMRRRNESQSVIFR
jgi:chitin synthase